MITCIPDSDIERFIEEDLPYGDLTTHLLGIGEHPGRIIFSTRDESNAAEYAATGIDIIVLSSVYFGKPADIGVVIQPV
jgi:nicotinate-nucleotide pyrophosphorylase